MSEDSKDMLAQDMWEADLVMTEAGMLVENALPSVYLDICVKSDPDYDEEFMQFLVPSIENEQLSYDAWRGGVVLC